MMRSVCVAGQLLLTDFIEKIEPYCTLFNLNTDGVFFTCESEENLAKIMDAQKEWESRTRLVLELEEYKRVIQKDVNNYMVVPHGELYTESGKPRYKAKGKYVKEQSDVDYDLPIVNKAVKYYFIKDIPPEETINNCSDLREFQKIVKLTKKFDRALKDVIYEKVKEVNPDTGRMRTVQKCVNNGYELQDKTYRVFASNRPDDGGLFKQKGEDNPAKFADTPDKCYIDNEEVLGKQVPSHLDKEWYIDLAYTRINHYLGSKNKTKKLVDRQVK